MIVLDACAAVDIVRQTERGRILRSMMLADERVISSDLFRVEVRNAFWKYVKVGNLTRAQARDYIAKAEGLVGEFCEIGPYADEGFAEGVRLDHSVYDMIYFIMARRRGALLLSSDSKLNRLCEENGVDCLHEV